MRKTGSLSFFSKLLEWHSTDKALLLIYFLIPIYVQSLVWSKYVLTRHDKETLVDTAYVENFIVFNMAMIFLCAIMIIIGAWVKGSKKLHLPFQHLAIHFFTWSMMVLAYSFGSTSYPVGIILIGAPLFGFILLDRQAVWIATVMCIMFLVAISYASTMGFIDYSPMLRQTLSADKSWFWTNTVFYFSLPFLIVNIVVIDHLLASWRTREDHVKVLATTDALTGVLNRREILHIFEKLAKTQRQQSKPASLIILDLDYFKKVNDTYGHPAGDAVLKKASSILKNAIRENDYLGRYGGEEFLIVLPGADKDQAVQIAERCRLSLESSPVTLKAGQSIKFTASFGLLCIEQFAEDSVESYIRVADEALYQSKSAGRNRVTTVYH